MLALGHAGITLGAAVLLAGTVTNSRCPRTGPTEATEPTRASPQTSLASKRTPSQRASWLTSLGSYIDIRILLIGSLLPDIIDKPVGQLFFRDTFSNGRIFCHTLLFLVLITATGVWLYRRCRKTWLLVLSFGTFTHLIFDQMWLEPQTLLWPLYGFAFPRADITHWLQDMIHALLTEAEVYVPELVGAAILAWFVVAVLRRRRIYAFVRHGQVG